MTEELRTQMDALRTIAPRLNQSSEDAARIIAEMHAFLEGLNLGIVGEGHCYKSASHIEHDPDDNINPASRRRQVASYLVYDRGPVGNAFSIHVRHDTSAPDPYDQAGGYEVVDTDAESWGSCSRNDRLKAFATLPTLLESIFKNATRAAEEAEKTTGLVRETMSSLGIEPTQVKKGSKTRG